MRLLIACGGTAGHIFPGLALAEEFKQQDQHGEIVLVISTHPRDRDFLAKSSLVNTVSIETVGTIPWPYHFSLRYLFSAVKLLWAILKSMLIILRYNPEVVVGFGGYAALAPLIAARIFRIPTVIHEQNFLPGRANQLLARFADRIAVTFTETVKFFPPTINRARIVPTGLPLRKQILTSLPPRLKSISEKLTVLVVGGSQGAHNINELVLDCLGLMDEASLSQIQLIHLTGKGDIQYVEARYKILDVWAQVFDFLEDMAAVYRTADLLIARSGASTIFEAASFSLPSVFIPYPWGTEHQRENALYLERQGAAFVLDEKIATALDLQKILKVLINNKNMREKLAQRIKAFVNPQAASNLKQQVFALSAFTHLPAVQAGEDLPQRNIGGSVKAARQNGVRCKGRNVYE